MPMRICILCGNAAHNRGDRANLSAQIALLKKRFPDALLTVCSDRAATDRKWYGVNVVPRGMPCSWALFRALVQADLVIWGGGALIADNAGRLLIPYWLLLICFVKIVLRKPVIAWAHGLVITTRTGALLGRMALTLCDKVTVRDEGSLRTARRLGITAVRTADPAVLFRPADADTGRSLLQGAGIPDAARLIGITPTFWQYYHHPHDLLPYAIARKMGFRKSRGMKEIDTLIGALAATADRLISGGAHIILLPRYASAPWPDLSFLQQIKERCAKPASVTVYTGDLPPEQYFSLWHHLDAVLSVALHDAVVAATLGVPTVQIVYEEKGADFASDIGSSDLTLPLAAFLQPSGPDAAAGLVRKAMDEWPDRIVSHRQCLARLQALAASNADEAATLLR